MTATLDALTIPLSLSVLTATKGHASKWLVPDVAGQPIRDPAHTLGISAGRVEHVQVFGLTGIADLLQRVTAKQALVHGVPAGSTPGEVFQLVVGEKFTGTPGTIARTKACIQYPSGPHLLMLDRDPEPEAEPIATAEELLCRMAEVLPAFVDVGWLATSSTSSAIRSTADQSWLRPPDGWHVYLVVTGDVERFRDLLKVRLWLAGHGFCKLATQNQQTGVCAILERALVDLTVFSPERLDYVAGALIAKSAPFYQDRPAPELHTGGVLDLDAFPDVTDEERAQYARLVTDAKERLTPERRARVREVVKAARPGHGASSPEEADAAIEHEVTARLALAERGALTPEHTVSFLNGSSLTAAALRGPEGKKRDGKRLADPQEPTYRQGDDAVFHWRHGDWRIVSWAHGVQTTYQLALPEPEPPVPDDDDMNDLLARVGDAENLDGLAAGARQNDDPRPPAVRYRGTPHGLVWKKPTKDGSTDVLLTNFTAAITAEITEDDGAEIQLRFALTAQLNGKTHGLEIPAAQFAGMSWVTAHLGAMAIVMPGMTLKDHARAAIQLLSPHVEHRRVYTHLGWRIIGEDWCYLHAQGAIGGCGAVEDITVAPGQALTSYQLPAPPDEAAAQAALRASLRVLDVASDAVTIPVYAALWRAVLGTVDCSVHLAGPTGQGKSALAALIQQHWGAGMDARHLPASWLSTGNALEGIAFQAKDAVLVVDDFCPAGVKADLARQHKEADRLLRAQGNRSGRQRMRADSTLRPSKPPRGLILSTGEDTPRGQSLRARMLILDVAPGMMQWDQLTACQDDAAAGVYTQALAGFVQWLAPRYGEIVQGLPAELRVLRQQALQGGHRRTPDIVAHLAVGMRYVLAYASDCGALALEECRAYWERTWHALGDAATAQYEHQAGEDPVDRFRALLAASLTAGLAHVADARTRTAAPLNAEHWGWRAHERGRDEDTAMVWQPLGACIGWLHGDRLYLDPEAAFSVVQRLADSQQAPLPVTQQTLWKRMHERGIVRREPGQQKNQARHTIGGKREYVIDIAAFCVPETGPFGPFGPEGLQLQQNQHAPLDLFPAWYQQKPVHSEITKPVHTTQPQSQPAWTDSASCTGSVLPTELVDIDGLQSQQNQGGGPEGPIGPEIEGREGRGSSAPSVNNMAHGDCPRCGAAQVTLVQQDGQSACVGCSLLSADELARRRPPMPTNGTHAPAPGVPLEGPPSAQKARTARAMRTVNSVPNAGACPTPGCPGHLKATGKGASAVVFCRTCKYRAYGGTAPSVATTDDFDAGIIT